ncbi:MAG: type I DNA topoisomerase [Candidatus Nanopelagicales bacterium]|nr:type I DNA topoisomerase [Candidatus Nanopelagicales bacterium]
MESPAKAKTIARYLGPGFEVEASVGHIRDLPNSASEVPARYKGLPWSKLAVDIEHDFAPIYVVHPSKKSKVAELKAKLSGADELLLATDEDREGEAIAWHLMEVLKPKVPVRRMVFHEITREAIERAVEQTRDLDRDLVDAQEARRVLDRLFGYEVSPVLWKKVMQRLSAGRVQSVALRLVVERERQRIAFVSADYWGLEALVDPGAFAARLISVDGARVARGDDFGPDGQPRKPNLLRLDEPSAVALARGLEGAELQVSGVDEKPATRRPAAPFITSTLQQEAARKLRWGAQRTMRVAQGLYERGFITYMRTDSTTLAESAIAAARAQAAELYGPDHVASAPRRYQRKVKNAQEAHEAIRPSGEHFRTPAQVAGELTGDDFALYDLVWKRTIASQMADAKVNTTTIRLAGQSSDGRAVEFGASGTVVVFRGFLAAYEEGSDEDDRRPDASADQPDQRRLPALRKGDQVRFQSVEAEGHATKPPARYTEASLVKQLEERGIGRPSTYASIMGTLVDRGYVRKRGSAMVPSWLAFAVVRLLEEHFARLVDYGFTAAMEETLDAVAGGDMSRLEVLKAFYFGGQEMDGSTFVGLEPLVAGLANIDARQISSFPISAGGSKSGSEGGVEGGEDSGIVLRVGRYGPYVEQGEARANVPEDLAPDELTVERARELLSAPVGDRSLGADPVTGHEVVARSGRYGPYVTEVLPEADASPEAVTEAGTKTGTKAKATKARAKAAKPRTASLFKDMSLESVTLDEALRLLSLPRTVGNHPADGEPILARNGRYGPYLTHGKDTRSLPDEASLFTITVDEAVALFAAPKQRRGAAASTATEVGEDPATKKPILLKEGRFGPYVTDGETNASLRRSDDPESLTLERAAELLADRRAAGPAPKRPRKRAASKS